MDLKTIILGAGTIFSLCVSVFVITAEVSHIETDHAEFRQRLTQIERALDRMQVSPHSN